VGYYQAPGTFYEYRITQIPDPSDNPGAIVDRRARHRIYKWVNGMATPLASVDTSPSYSPLTGLCTTTVEMRLYNTSETQTRIVCRCGNTDNILAVTDGATPLQGGTFGFASSECSACCTEVRTLPTTTGAALVGSTETYYLRSYPSDVFDSDVLNWYVPAGRYVARNTITPRGIYSVTPSQKLGVYVQDTDWETRAEPGAAWRLVQEVTVSSYTYQTVTVPLNAWRSQYVKLQVLGGGCDVAVDQPAVTSWHGKKAGTGDANPADWLAAEAWVVSNRAARATAVQLDHARGDPAVAQGVRSPLLDAGLGSMEFDCRVLRAPAALTVQYALASAPDEWTDVQTFDLPGVTDWSHHFAFLGRSEPGFFRVVNARSGAATNALVEIDNALVWDEPPVDERSWKAYNAKITETDLTRVALDQSRACFLNNSQTAEADPVQNLAEPYVQSSRLPNGLGLLSFAARVYDPGQTATVYVRASTNGWGAAESLWFEVARFEDITNSLYTRYTFVPPEGLDVDAVRLATGTSGGARRVCLEDIVAAEPLGTAADIVSVQAWPQKQTLTRSDVAVAVTVRLAGRFALRKGVPEADEAAYPRLGLRANGGVVWAPLHHLNTVSTPGGWRTDAVFRYTVRPGDMAVPLRLAGSGRARDPYRFDWRGWEIVNVTTSSNAVWRFNQSLMAPSDAYDPDLSGAGLSLRTLAFDASAPEWVSASRTVTWRVLTDRDVGAEPFQIRVWTPHTNLVQVGSVPGQASLLLDVVSGGTLAAYSEAAFTVTGLAEGEAEIVVQRADDFEVNATAGVANEIRRAVTVTPQPLGRWNEIEGRLAGGGTYRVEACDTDAAGATVVCDGGGAGAVFRFISDSAVAFTNLTLVVSNGATVVMDNLAIDNGGVEERPAVFAADGHPQNRLELGGRNAASGGPLAAGVRVGALGEATNRLTIASFGGAAGGLTVCGGELAAGLGGSAFEAGGAVAVQGGVSVTARGGEFGSGVGGGVIAAGGSLEVGGGAAVLATGGGFGARDVGYGAYGGKPSCVALADGLILSGSGVGGVAAFAPGATVSQALGPFDPSGCWYAFARDGSAELGWLYVAGQTVGLHSVSNASPAGAYALVPEGGGAAVTFELAEGGTALPAGVRRDPAFYRPWLERYGLGGADLSALAPEAFDTAWLLDQDPQDFVAGELTLTGVETGPDAVRVTYTLRAVALGGTTRVVTRLNGRLAVLYAWSLDEPLLEAGDVTGSVEAGSYAFEIPYLAGARFFKLVVAFPEEP
jgi:hypothetical protein